MYNYYTSSYYSSTHNQSIERQRILIRSGLLAIRHRKAFITEHFPNHIFPYERLKYMRWICSVQNAISAQLKLKEYLNLLEEFRKEGVYPLEYAWIKVAGGDYSLKIYFKRVIQTFFTNHPILFYPFVKYFHRLKEIIK